MLCANIPQSDIVMLNCKKNYHSNQTILIPFFRDISNIITLASLINPTSTFTCTRTYYITYQVYFFIYRAENEKLQSPITSFHIWCVLRTSLSGLVRQLVVGTTVLEDHHGLPTRPSIRSSQHVSVKEKDELSRG